MTTRRSLPRRSVWLPVTLLSTLAGCGEPVASPGGAASLSVSFATSASVPTNASGNAVIVGSSGDTLFVNRVQLVVDEVELQRAGVTVCPDNIAVSTDVTRSSDDGGCSRLDLGPMLLDLPLNSNGALRLGVAVPAGLYREFEFEIDKVSTDGDASASEKAFVAAHPEFRDVSVRVTGSYKGVPFTFVSRLEAEVEYEFEPALSIAAGVNDNITVAVDLNRWFRNSVGALLVPNSANQSRIEQNIVTSIEAFGDRNRDGREDPDR